MRGPHWETTGRAAIQGLLAWLVYATVEISFLLLRPLLENRNQILTVEHCRASLTYILIYVSFGLASGGLLGLALPRSAEKRDVWRPQLAGTFGLAVAYATNVVFNWRDPLFVSMAVMPVVCLVAAAVSRSWQEHLGFLANPWILLFFAVVVPSGIDYLWLPRWIGILLLAAVIAPTVYAARKLSSRIWSPDRMWRQVSLALAALTIVVVASWHLNRRLLSSSTLSKLAGHQTDSCNVVLIVMDSVRADHLPMYGYSRDTAPNLRRLAEGATLYTRLAAAADFTLPSHASILTGMPSETHGVYLDRALPESLPTVTQVLRDNGYATAAVAANGGFLVPEFGLLRGFQFNGSQLVVSLYPPQCRYLLNNPFRRVADLVTDTSRFDQLYRSAREINDVVYPVLDTARSLRVPFFLLVNYMDAHAPYIPPPPFDTLFEGKRPGFHLRQFKAMEFEVMSLRRGISDSERRHCESQYDGGIAYIDDHVGSLLARLEQLGLYDNTLIIVTSDHGEVFGDRGFLEHGVSVYQDQVHVPLIIKYPRENRKRTFRTNVAHIDLFPTILGAAHIRVPAGVNGCDLAVAEEDPERVVVSESHEHARNMAGDEQHRSRFERDLKALFCGDVKLISSSNGQFELYDLSVDPTEQNDLFDSDEPRSKALTAALDSWRQRTPPATINRPGSRVDQEVLDQLQALGYGHGADGRSR